MSEQSARIRMLYDTTTRWESANPILLKGEMGVEDKGGQGFAIKFGDGMTNWNLLPYTTLSPNEIKQLKSDLQAQIDSIVTSSTGTGDSAAEVAQSRITADGILFDDYTKNLVEWSTKRKNRCWQIKADGDLKIGIDRIVRADG